MNFKIFGYLFMLFLFVHVGKSTPVLRDDLKEIIVAVFNKILEGAENVLKKVNIAINKTESSTDEIQQEVVSWLVTESKKLSARLIKVINELDDGATDDGKALLGCISDDETQIDSAFQKIATDIGNCATGENTLILGIFRDIVGQLSDFESEVKKEVTTLSSCSDSDISCFQAFLSSAVETVKEIPDSVNIDFQKFLNLIKAIASDLSQCATNISSDIKTSVQQIINDVGACVKN